VREHKTPLPPHVHILDNFWMNKDILEFPRALSHPCPFVAVQAEEAELKAFQKPKKNASTPKSTTTTSASPRSTTPKTLKKTLSPAVDVDQEEKKAAAATSRREAVKSKAAALLEKKNQRMAEQVKLKEKNAELNKTTSELYGVDYSAKPVPAPTPDPAPAEGGADQHMSHYAGEIDVKDAPAKPKPELSSSKNKSEVPLEEAAPETAPETAP